MPPRLSPSSSFLILSLALTSAAGRTETLFDIESKVRLSIRHDPATGRTVTEQRKVNYHPQFAFWAGDMRAVVVHETVETTQVSGFAGTRSRLQVEIYLASDNQGNFPKTPESTLELPNTDETRFLYDHWSAWNFGCCDAESYGRLYSYGGTRPFLCFNGRYWKISVPNDDSKTRYVGLALRDHIPNDAAREALFAGHPDAVACLSYAAPGKPLDRIYLKPRKGVSWSGRGLRTGALVLKSGSSRDEVRTEGDRDGNNSIPVLEMWSLDGAEPVNGKRPGLSGVRITAPVSLDDGTSEALTVSVQADRLVYPKISGQFLEEEEDSSSDDSSTSDGLAPRPK